MHGSGMSNSTTASPKPFFRVPWRVDDTVVGGENAGWTTSKSGHPYLCQNCWLGPPAEKAGIGSLLNLNCLSCLPSPPPNDPTGHGTPVPKSQAEVVLKLGMVLGKGCS